MRARPPVPSIALLVPALVLGGCEGGEIDDATRARVVALGDSAAMILIGTLGGELAGRLDASGPAGAIRFCAGEAQALTDSVSAGLGEGWEVKRTTLRTRNPRNAPDSMEAEALRLFHGAGEPPAHHVQRTPAGNFRYYRPLRIGELCLRCHGERDRLDPAVREVLETRYPADQATGYAEGELRGLVRVTVPRSALD